MQRHVPGGVKKTKNSMTSPTEGNMCRDTSRGVTPNSRGVVPGVSCACSIDVLWVRMYGCICMGAYVCMYAYMYNTYMYVCIHVQYIHGCACSVDVLWVHNTYMYVLYVYAHIYVCIIHVCAYIYMYYI